MGILDRLLGRVTEKEDPWVWPEPPPTSIIRYDELPNAAAITPPTEQYGWWGGDKYHGGFGPTQIFEWDYWTLRARSAQLFTENLYARGLLRRLVSNVINTGLTLEAVPEERTIGLPEDSLTEWSEAVENAHHLYATHPRLCDYEERRTLYQIQAEAFLEALISGDVLVILYLDRIHRVPKIQLVSGNAVKNPSVVPPLPVGHTLREGVELDARGRHVAYYVQQEINPFETRRVPAYGARSGRRVAWLFYGGDKRMSDVRGQPFLSLFLQSLKEIDRYRDSAQRKAAINAVMAAFIKKTEDKPSTLPITGGAVRRNQVAVEDTVNTERKFNITELIPGMIFEELQVGEEPVPYSTAGTDVSFGPFEEAIVSAIAWSAEIPPEILRLSFSSNYSASQAAINEFKLFLNKERGRIGAELAQPGYVEWFISSALTGRISAPGFLDVWRDPARVYEFAAWTAADWTGAIKPSTDLVKQTKGYKVLTAEGWITNDRAARELTGTKWTKNIKRLRRENEMKAEAMRPLLELAAKYGAENVESAAAHLEVVK